LLNRKEIGDKSREFVGSTTIFQDDLKNLKEPRLENVCDIIKKIEKKGNIRKSRLLQKYFLNTETWISEVLSTLSSEGTAYIVVGPSTSYEIRIDTPKYLEDIIRLENYNVCTLLKYDIKNQRMQYPTRNGAKIKTETVLAISR
jgi:hypothetical protein